MSFTPTVDDTDRYETIDITAERFTYPVSTATLAGVAAPIKGNNLLKASNNISDSSWTKTRATPGATVDVTLTSGEVVTLTKLVEDGTVTNTHQISLAAAPPVRADLPSVFRMLVKQSDAARNGVRVELYGDSYASVVLAQFNVEAGTVQSTLVGGAGTLLGSSIEAVGDGTYLCTLEAKPSVTAGNIYTDVIIKIIDDVNTSNYSGDSTSGVYIGQMQLTEGTEATTYNQTTTERISGDGQRLTHSWDLSNAAWTKTNVTGVSAGSIAYTNAATLDTGEVLSMAGVYETVTNAFHIVAQSSDLPAASSVVGKVRVKGGLSRDYVRFVITNASASADECSVIFRFSTGAFSTGATLGGTAVSGTASVASLGDGVYELTMTTVCSTGAGVASLRVLLLNDSIAQQYAGDVTKGVYVTEPIIVAGSTAPSYTRSYADRLAAGGSTRGRAYVLLPHIQEFDASGTHVGTLWDIDKPLVLTDGTDTDTRQIQFTAPVPANYAAVAAPAPYQWAPDGAGPTDNAYLHEIQAGNARKNPKRWEYDLATGQAEIWAMAGNTITGQWRARRVVRDFVRRMTNGAGTYEYARARQEEDELIQIMAAFLSTR